MDIVQLCGMYNPGVDDVSGWVMSEKFDGQAALWDGVRLLTRSGKPIAAPSAWLAALPPIPLHGELWLRRGVGCLQDLRKIVSKAVPDAEEWRAIKFLAHSAPILECSEGQGRTYAQELDVLAGLNCAPDGPLQVIAQERLPMSLPLARDRIEERMAEVDAMNGEGVILRNPDAVWVAERTQDVLKHKLLRLDEGVVVGHVAGKAGKFQGMIGALMLEMGSGVRFRIGQLLKDERALEVDEDREWAEQHPGKQMPVATQARAYPVGARVEFIYRDLSARGVPLEPRLAFVE